MRHGQNKMSTGDTRPSGDTDNNYVLLSTPVVSVNNKTLAQKGFCTQDRYMLFYFKKTYLLQITYITRNYRKNRCE